MHTIYEVLGCLWCPDVLSILGRRCALHEIILGIFSSKRRIPRLSILWHRIEFLARATLRRGSALSKLHLAGVLDYHSPVSARWG